jgi:hypothetical protein
MDDREAQREASKLGSALDKASQVTPELDTRRVQRELENLIPGGRVLGRLTGLGRGGGGGGEQGQPAGAGGGNTVQLSQLSELREIRQTLEKQAVTEARSGGGGTTILAGGGVLSGLGAAGSTAGAIGGAGIAAALGLEAGKRVNRRVGLADNESIQQVGGPASLPGGLLQAGSVGGGLLADQLGLREEAEAAIQLFKTTQLFDFRENAQKVLTGLRQAEFPEPTDAVQTVATQLSGISFPEVPDDVSAVATKLDSITIPEPPNALTQVANTLDDPQLNAPPWVDQLLDALTGNQSDREGPGMGSRNFPGTRTDQPQLQIDVGGVTVDVTNYDELRRSLEQDLVPTVLDEVRGLVSGP